MTLRQGQPEGWKESGAGKKGKGAYTVLGQGHTEAKVRAGIPGEMSCGKMRKVCDFPDSFHTQ